MEGIGLILFFIFYGAVFVYFPITGLIETFKEKDNDEKIKAVFVFGIWIGLGFYFFILQFLMKL